MKHFETRGGSLFAEGIPLERIAAEFGTPTFVYSRAALTDAHAAYAEALTGRDTMLCYAVKSNSNLAILNLFARLGTGFDIVSGGELARVIAAGGDPARVVFSGVGKTRDEMRAALEHGIYCFNVESEPELHRLAEVAGDLSKRAPIALRVNPDVDPKTHPYISTGLKCNKFGVPINDAHALYLAAAKMPQLDIRGIACHIGSQLLDPAPVAEAAAKVVALAEALNRDGIELRHLDLGGGLGIRYDDETVPATRDYLAPLLSVIADRKERLLLEPGRSLVGNAGVLLSKVEYLKRGEDRNFAIIDAAMNDLARPALYDAFHRIAEVRPRGTPDTYDVVGPVCESGDFLGRSRKLAVEPEDLVAIFSAGAYGMTMSSNYNTRARAAEVMVDGDVCHLIRARERIEDLYAGERLLP
ncbi:diaminopimelate decarboxylase [Methyloversatilis sp.]|uniref:diaminopimelate decarboxylase n=1 Tax=Methyloversatilis sp. TaxID=2569862 RepID=UPI00273276BD|nr:diaminopimelate decarboxylase [Methyloversatilis sp.]MDP2869037.1 diaminopimelate decarboxylase [Methyloversatilis sp.]MDP3457410.1 diaminopimelate decarboxylase [Methyloversatilis sp.]MDP3578615.1 diaminopimelate decarboxylase [Methyloversatilis sp.]